MFYFLILGLVGFFLTATQAVPAERPWYAATDVASQTMPTSSITPSLSTGSPALDDAYAGSDGTIANSSVSVTAASRYYVPWLDDNRLSTDIIQASEKNLVVTMFMFKWLATQSGGIYQVMWFNDWASGLQSQQSRPIFYKVDPESQGYSSVSINQVPTVIYWKNGKEVARVEGSSRPAVWGAQANSLTPWSY